MVQEIPFEPFRFAEDPHRQTIMNAFCNHMFGPTSEQKIVNLPDGDKISLEVTTPEGWEPSKPTVVLVHGLCGSHQSPNLVRMSKRMESNGIRAVRFNMRGCGSGRGLSRNIYHSGRSEDLFEAIKALKMEHPTSPIVLVGFSLGGNIALKLVGELGKIGKRFLHKAIAVSPPVDLALSIRMLGEPQNSLYESYFYRLLRDDVYYLHKVFGLPRISLPKNLKLYEFDQIYTAPVCGFKNVDDYYSKCSALHVVSHIDIPTKILLAEDDPIVSSASLDQCPLPECVALFKTKKGGHMGYIGAPGSEKGFYWLDSLLVDWILEGFDKL